MSDTYFTNANLDNLWSTAANWSGASVPTNSDNAFVDGSRCANANILGGTFTAPNKLLITNYSGAFGASGNNAIFQTSTMAQLSIQANAGAKIYIEGSSTITEAIVKVEDWSTDAVNLFGTMTTAYPLLGYCNIASATVTDIVMSYVRNAKSDCVLNIASGVTINGDIEQDGGQLFSQSGISGNYIAENANATWTLGDLDTGVVVLNRSRLIYNTSGGTIDDIRVGSGATLDLTRNSNARTVAACRVKPTGLIDARNGAQGSITFTATPVVIGAGGRVLTPDGTQAVKTLN